MHYTQPEVYEFISRQTGDPIVEWKICELSGTEFPITQKDLEFYEKISPVFNGKKYLIPTPKLCPEERQRRRLMFRNERKLYRRKCDATGEMIVSLYSSDKQQKVYSQQYRWSDKRNPFEYGLSGEEGFSATMKKLIQTVPLMSIMNDNGVGSTNSEYCNNFSYGKNCYMIHTSRHGTDSMYSSSCNHIDTVYDCDGLGHSQYCYECIESNELSYCRYVSYSDTCANIYRGKGLQGCTNCIACTNLVNQQYHILNIPCSKEKYEQILHAIRTDRDYAKMMETKYQQLLDETVLPVSHIKNSTTVFGDSVFESTDVVFGYTIYKGQHCKYYYGGADSPRHGYDITVGGDHDYVYEGIVPDLSYQTAFTVYCRSCKHAYYSIDCHRSEYLFGCVGLRDVSYCIYNKQYSPEDYNVIVPQIIKQMQNEGTWGEFFDPQWSVFGYNETLAQEYFPLSQQEVEDAGCHWQTHTYDPVIPAGVEVIQGEQIPRFGSEVDESILKKVLVCEVTGRPYRLTKQELMFYKKYQLPLPRKHPDRRYTERMQKKSGRNLHLRKCDATGRDMISVYPEGSPMPVYSQQAYTEAFYT